VKELVDIPSLPKGWAYASFAEISDSIPLTGKKLKQREYAEKGELPVIDQGQEFVGGRTDHEEYRIAVGSPVIIFGDHTKVIKYVDFDFVAGADGIKVIKPEKVFSPKLFYYFLKAIKLPEKGYARHYQYLEKSIIPVPPLKEQYRISAKVDELFSFLDAGLESLRKVQAQLKHYRQAVLKYAFEGKLTEEWRKNHKDQIEPAQKLLDRIRLRKSLNKKLDGMPKIPNSTKFVIPNDWVMVTLEEISANIVDCLHSTPKFNPSGKYCIDTNCIEPSRILFEKARFVSEKTFEERIRRLSPKTGDVLFAREGTIGTSVAVPENMSICLGQRMMMFRPEKEVNSSYFMWGLMSPFFENQWKARVTGSTVAHINIRDIRTMLLPLASVEEQSVLTEKVERLLSIANEIEKILNENLLLSEQMRQSILKNAFEGKLIPQTPDDEPAEKLLERIEAERFNNNKSKSNNQLELSSYVK
jgi:type I restriction enzyme S subunit